MESFGYRVQFYILQTTSPCNFFYKWKKSIFLFHLFFSSFFFFSLLFLPPTLYIGHSFRKRYSFPFLAGSFVQSPASSYKCASSSSTGNCLEIHLFIWTYLCQPVSSNEFHDVNISIHISIFIKDTNNRGSLNSNCSLTSIMYFTYNWIIKIPDLSPQMQVLLSYLLSSIQQLLLHLKWRVLITHHSSIMCSLRKNLCFETEKKCNLWSANELQLIEPVLLSEEQRRWHSHYFLQTEKKSWEGRMGVYLVLPCLTLALVTVRALWSSLLLGENLVPRDLQPLNS